MNYTIKVSSAAFIDIEEAITWYEIQSEGLGNRIEHSLLKGLDFVKVNPLLAALKYKDIRVKYIGHFPYGIHFFIEENIIYVIGFFHMNRDPISWDERFSDEMK